MTAEHEFVRQKSTATEIALPDKLAKIKKADEFPAVKYKWNSNEEVLSLLISLGDHGNWVTKQVQNRPENGTMFIFDRSKVRDYRKDGYTWKKRRSGNTIREDHTRLKVDKVECLSVLYTHSALVPTFHRRCYWMLQNPDIVLVHYLNLVEECVKPITVSVYAPPDSNDDISKQLEAIYAGVPPDSKPEVTVSEESPPGSPSSSEDSEKASKNGRRRKRNKAVYKISIFPNKNFQTRTGKLRVKFIKVTQDEQGRLTVSGHREGSPSLEEEDSSLEGNDSGTADDPNHSTYQSAVNGSRDGHMLVTSPLDFSPNQSPRDLGMLSAVPMVTRPVTSVLTSQLQNSCAEVQQTLTSVVQASSSQFRPENHSSNAISGNHQHSAESTVDRNQQQHTGIQWNLIFGNASGGAGNVNQRLAELGSSPSSDYGSYMSDAGTRLSFSGSESTSSGLPAQGVVDSDHALFDGPFRIPLPVDRDSQSAKTDRGLPQQHGHEPWTVSDYTPTTSPSSNDVAVEMAELGPLEFDMFDCDLSHVIPECFSACLNSPVKQSESPMTTSSSTVAKTTDHTRTNTAQQPPPVVLSPFATATPSPPYASSPGVTSGPATTSGLPSTTSYAFVNPVSPTRTTVVTSCYVNVTNNTQATTSGDCVSQAVSKTPMCYGQESSEVNMKDVSASNAVTPRSSNTGGFNPAPVQSSYQPKAAALPSDTNNNSLRELKSRLSNQTKSSHSGHHFVPVSARITDFSPEWSYPEGGAKVLITGEWTSVEGSYTCLFDGCSVPADLYQSGVLRCYCPPHDPGLVTLQVACNGFIVSNACVFEYRARDSPAGSASCHEWLATDGDRFKLAILDRLERLESKLFLNQTVGQPSGGGHQCTSFEERLVCACEILQRASGSEKSFVKSEKPFRGMTLLHLAAALGYNKVVCTLLQLWRESDNAVVMEEVNPLRKDEFACTPLMWACALGQRSTAHMLLEAQPRALLEPDARGRMPLQLARDRGYLEVVDVIEDFILSSPRSRKFLSIDDSPDGPPSPMAASCEDFSRPPLSAPSMFSLLTAPNGENAVDRSSSPMFVDEDDDEPPMCRKPARTLAKTLVQIHSMISEAEQEAELNHRTSGHLSPLHENTELVTSGSWSSAVRLRTFSSASSQSSPLTPCSSKSSLSPGSPSFLNSPHSSPAGPDTTEFQEFISSSRKLLEREISDLTLTDREQWELYEAAKIIQHAYRNYKTRCNQQEQEMEAAVLIQNHYRRYKEYIAFKKMTHAAMIIQSQYRTYREHERFKKSRRAAAIIQNHFRNYRERRRSSQRRREERFCKRQEARYMQKASKRSKDSS